MSAFNKLSNLHFLNFYEIFIVVLLKHLLISFYFNLNLSVVLLPSLFDAFVHFLKSNGQYFLSESGYYFFYFERRSFDEFLLALCQDLKTRRLEGGGNFSLIHYL